MFKSQLRVTQFQNREVLKFAVGSAVAKFDADLNKDVYSKLVERQMKCAVCGGSYFEKECKTDDVNMTFQSAPCACTILIYLHIMKSINNQYL